MPKAARHRRRFRHNVIAIVYDFDGTLTPQPMQEYTILPKIGMRPKKFWADVEADRKVNDGEQIVTYMRLMLELADQKKVGIKKGMLRALAKRIKYYPGLSGRNSFFSRMNTLVRKKSKGKVQLRHYVISAGLKEILEGTEIRKNFHRMFGSEYHYNHYGAADFPKMIVNDTLKTQLLFRINKGKELPLESINTHMPPAQRAIPFQNILYIGDGLTDVPCMAVTMKEGGYSIAVHGTTHKELNVCRDLWRAGRVHFVAKADYRPRSDLSLAVQTTLETMVQGVTFANALFREELKHDRRTNSG